MLNESEERPVRRHPVHGIKYVEGQSTIIFETICVKQRLQVLANDRFHAAFRSMATESTDWLIGRYVIMPDHIHLFAADVGNATPYENWIKYLKSQLTRKVRPTTRGRGSRQAAARSSNSNSPDPIASDASRFPSFRWLTDHWDTRVRSRDAYEEKWLYVLNNPVRQGLVAKPEDWPFQGEIYQLRW